MHNAKELYQQRMDQIEQMNYIRFKTPDPQHVLITDKCISVLHKHRSLLNDVNYWHQFMVRNVDHAKREQVLTAILDHVFPFDLIPVSYWVEDDFVFFLGRNCGSAIEKLCNGNLVVPNPKSTTPIDDIDSLQHLTELNLTDLFLDGNPLCSKYGPEEYFAKISKHLKYLTHLDGLPLRKDGFPVSRRHYMCDLGAADLINQFIEYYFYLYDLPNRDILKMAYQKDAMFSLTASYIADQISSSRTKMPKYLSLSRNMQKMSNFSQCHNNLIRGNQQIVNILKNLPLTEHYRPSFAVELIHYTNTCAVVSVSGVFKDSADNLLDAEQIFGFRRTFVLAIKPDGACVITNEMMHVHNALTWQQVTSFKQPRSVIRTIEFPKSESDHQKAINAFKRITTLDTQWAKRCLEDRQYNMKMALLLFVDLYKQNKIPPDGFVKTGTNNTYEGVGNDQYNQNKKMRV
ncbi:nuclear RNA export factor 2-like isoform X2 [Diabrotica virgifera virgifera]|uniref:Nuclear RNA export factor 2-like isoform X2 n=1 Tax=Diabrotica virgifera virgifera TaxID=50390 RepID=A0A6P7FAY2_DIAVI|nr:nuclear RNA export factor 2-like isoform X2 [Diabrotica virgifera virgifera]